MSKQSLKKSFVRTAFNVLARETGRIVFDDAGVSIGASVNSETWQNKFKYCLCKNREIFKREVEIINEVYDKIRKPFIDELNEKEVVGKQRTSMANTVPKDKRKLLDEITIKHEKILDDAEALLGESIDVDVFEYKGVMPDNTPMDLFDVLLTAHIIPEPIDTEPKK